MKALLTPLALICAITQAHAKEADQQALDLRMQGSVLYGSDSAVGITEIDQISLESDSEIRWNINPTAQWALNDKTVVSAGYNLTLSQYQTLEDYDTDIGDMNMGIKHEWSWGDTGYRFDHVSARVAGEDFLTLKMHTADWGKLFNNRVYTRIAAVKKEKSFDRLVQRDADTLGLNTQLFIFSEDYKNTFIVGASAEQEEAAVTYYSKDTTQLSLAWAHKTSILNRDSKIKLSARYNVADYQAFNPQLEVVREDTFYDVAVETKVTLTKNFFALAEAIYSDQQSNDASADYNRSIVRIGFGFILD